MKKALSYKVEYSVDPENGQVIATVPELDNLSTFGDAFAEAEANIREAAVGYLEVLRKKRRARPEPVAQTEGTYLRVFEAV